MPVASGTSVTVARFGIKVADAVDSVTRAARSGAIVTDLKRGGPADGAGLQIGDLVVEVNGKRIARHADLDTLADDTGVRGRILVRIMRDNAGRTVEMTVADPAASASGNTSNSARAPVAVPNVVGLSIAGAREALWRVGLDFTLSYVESTNESVLVKAQSAPAVDAQNRRVVALQVGIQPTVFVYHAPPQAGAAEDLAAHLRGALGDRLASIRPVGQRPSDMGEGELQSRRRGLRVSRSRNGKGRLVPVVADVSPADHAGANAG